MNLASLPAMYSLVIGLCGGEGAGIINKQVSIIIGSDVDASQLAFILANSGYCVPECMLCFSLAILNFLSQFPYAAAIVCIPICTDKH